jgi:SAM-dependent methyltransferase
MSPRLSAYLIADLVDAGSREHYQDAALYDYEYRRRRADLAFYKELAKRRLGESGRILELGAGSGRITIPLARAGYEVVAVDSSRPMLDKLRARVDALPSSVARRITVVEADLRSFALADPDAGRSRGKARGETSSPTLRAARAAASSASVHAAQSAKHLPRARAGPRAQFPLAIAVFNVLEHLHPRGELDACLGCVRDHLAPGGAFAFDVQLPDLEWLTRDPAKRWARTRFTDPTTRRQMFYSTNHDYDPVAQIALIRLYYEPVDGKGAARIVKLSQRKYFPAELEALVAHAGLRIVERYGDFGGRPLDATAESQVLVCEAANPPNPRREKPVSRRGFRSR